MGRQLMNRRKDTKLEAESAIFLVLADMSHKKTTAFMGSD
jgi:hypothetical protein